MKLSVIKKGFSLIEVVVALFILSISVITIYNLIISTSVSSYDLEQRYLAKEVANNHIALLNTIEKPLRSGNRKGEMIMGVKIGFGMKKYTIPQMKIILNMKYVLSLQDKISIFIQQKVI